MGVVTWFIGVMNYESTDQVPLTLQVGLTRFELKMSSFDMKGHLTS